MSNEKKQLREKYLSLRNNILNTNLKEISNKILLNLYKLDEYKNCKTIFTYVNANSEIITMPLIEKAWEDEKNIAVPVIGKKAHEMFFVKINSFKELKPNKYNILEPELKEENIICSNNETLVIVPGLVFSPDKYRIGYGGGYYDKFIAENTTLSNIALAMDFQIIKNIPKDNLDKTVDKIVTETKIY